MKKKLFYILIFITIILLYFIYYNILTNKEIFINTSTKKIELKEVVYKKYGSNIYYNDELINTKKNNEDIKFYTRLDYLSKYIQEKYPDINVYLYNFNYDTLNKENNEMIFNFYQMLNNYAFAESTYFVIELENNKITYTTIDNVIFINNNLVEIEKLITKDTIKSSMYETIKDYYKKDNIVGEYYLVYNENNKLVYNVNVNKCSNVVIDAYSGNIIDSFLFNCVYT